MAVVGSAEVVVRAITNKVRSDIERAFKDAAPAVSKAGDEAGQRWADSFKSTVQSSLGSSLDDAFDDVDASIHGERAGRDFAAGAAGGIGSGGGGRIGDAAEKEFGGAGRRGGNAFNRAMNSAWADAAVAASRAFTSIYALGNFAGVGIAGLVSAVSTLVTGLYAVASAAGAALGALAALPGILGALLQAGGAMKLAFSGVGEALKAGMKPMAAQASQAVTKSYAVVDAQKAVARAANDAAKNQVAANRKVSDAQRELGRAVADAARARADADRKVVEAARAVGDAEQELLNITRELNAARKEAAESLQQLAFSAEDAALAEERAAMRLEDAHAKLVAAQNLPPDSRGRREAELNYKEAELNYRQAKDRNADLAEEQKRAAKAGIEGSNEVMAVKRQIADAEKKLADREQALADARAARRQSDADSAEKIADRQQALFDAELARQQAIADGAQRVSDAQESLRRAQESAAQAAAKSTAAANAYSTAMAKLSPQAQEFVRYLISIRGEFDRLKASAGAELFPRLQQAIDPLIKTTLPILETRLRTTGQILGDYAIGVSSAITRGSLFDNLLKSQNETLAIFNRTGDNGRTVMDDLTTVILRVLTAIQPLTQRFAEWTASLIEGAEAATDTKEEMDSLTGFFDRAGDRASLLGDIVGNVVGIFRELGRAASPAGTGLLESFRAYTAEWEKTLSTDGKQAELKTYFADVADNFRAISDLVSDISAAFFGLADNKGIGEFAESLKPAVENIRLMGENMTGAGPALGEFITKITEIMLALADQKGFEIFFGILNKVLDPIVAFTKSDFGGTFLLWAGGITAATRALSFIGIVGGKIFKILSGGPIALYRAFKRFQDGGIKGLIRSFFGLDKGSKKSGKGLAGLSTASDAAKRAFERQIVTDKQKTKVLLQLQLQADKTALSLKKLGRAAMPTAMDKRGAAGGAMKPGVATNASTAIVPSAAAAKVPPVVSPTTTKNVGTLGKVAGGASKGVTGLGKGLGALSMGLLGISGPVALAIGAVVGLVIGLRKLYQHSPEFKKFVDGIIDKFKALGSWISGIFSKYVLPTLNTFFGWVNKQLPIVKEWFANVFGAIGDFISKNFVPIWQNVLVPAFQTAWGIIQPILGLLWNGVKIAFEGIKYYAMNVLLPAWGLVWQGLQTAWTFIQPILLVLWNGVKIAFEGIKFIVMNVLLPAFRAIWSTLQTVWAIIKPIIDAIWSAIKIAFEGILWAWNNILKPAFFAIKDGFQSISNKVGTVVEFVKKRWEVFTTNFSYLRDKVGEIVGGIRKHFQRIVDKVQGVVNIVQIKWGTFKADLESLRTSIRDKVDLIKENFQQIPDKIQAVRESISAKIAKIKENVGSLETKFESVATGIKKAWGKVTGYVKKPMKDAMKWVQDNFVVRLRGWLDKIPGIKGKDILPDLDLKGWATGGWTGRGSKYQPAGIVHADEYVLRKEATRKLIQTIGLSGLNYMNQTGSMPGSAGRAGSGGGTGGGSGLPGYYIGGKVKGLNKRFLEQLAAFNKAAGGRYSVYSGYRSIADQTGLYARYLAGRGPVAAAPGSSKHNFGLAADLAPSNARDMHQSLARKFGLVFTVPSESWHIEPDWGRSGKSSGFSFGLPDWVKSPMNWVKDKISDVFKGYDASKFGLVGEIIPSIADKVKGAIVNKVRDAASKFGFGDDGGKGFSGGGSFGGGGAEKWRSTVRKALGILGLSDVYANATLRRMNQESSGDPKAINNWDSNAKRGTPSKGLMQVIEPTFRAYALKGYNTNIWDPLSNIIASMRYAISRYGNLFKAYDRKGGYAWGTDFASAGWHLVGENGPELLRFRGGEQVYNRQQTLGMVRAAAMAPGIERSSGLSPKDRAIIETLNQALLSRNAGGDTFNIHPAPGMSESELASLVSRRVTWRKSVGT